MSDQPTKVNWLNREPFVVDERTFTAFKNVKKRFDCKLCGHTFAVGDGARWIYANGTPGMGTGNFFVCAACDGEDVLERAKVSLETAVRMAKQWDIYGPDWQRDALRERRP